MSDQFSLQRIHVHVVKLFNSFLQTPDVEIVETALPETVVRSVEQSRAELVREEYRNSGAAGEEL